MHQILFCLYDIIGKTQSQGKDQSTFLQKFKNAYVHIGSITELLQINFHTLNLTQKKNVIHKKKLLTQVVLIQLISFLTKHVFT